MWLPSLLMSRGPLCLRRKRSEAFGGRAGMRHLCRRGRYPEHLLQGLVEQGDGSIVRALGKAGVDSGHVACR